MRIRPVIRMKIRKLRNPQIQIKDPLIRKLQKGGGEG